MTCPRCGTETQSWPCPNCGFPVGHLREAPRSRAFRAALTNHPKTPPGESSQLHSRTFRAALTAFSPPETIPAGSARF